MDTRYLKTLSMVLSTGSFSKAAEELYITQSAVSQRIKAIEEQFGLPLLDRSGTVLQPTDAGEAVLKAAEQILAIEHSLKKELQNLGRKPGISLCCTPTFGIVYLPHVLNRFFLCYSEGVDLKFMLNTPERSLKGVLANDFDLAVIEHCENVQAAGAEVYQLPADELIFISAPALQIPGKDVRLQDLTCHRLIARRDGCSSRHLLESNLSRFGKSLEDFNGTIVYDDLHLTIQSVLSGNGVAFVSRSMVDEQLEKGTLREHMVDGFASNRLRSIVVNGKRGQDPLIKSLIASIFSAV
ncbi:LysR family transcriptional regulator [Geomonas sp.]|uniref:LysR family transcriptional regulator n=1 Tax=Geomonas sp. TaxID=2651584 RepID=UPI002B49DDFD|nr:LysR family transcriptional regulator [Geomonas sp.]HJV35323.1 LysR family transcriptional regulator [Geomonas sp.]